MREPERTISLGENDENDAAIIRHCQAEEKCMDVQDFKFGQLQTHGTTVTTPVVANLCN